MASVRFKFRSSATFDSVDIGEQSSISIRDLKAKIVLKNHLNLSQDFDLVFSDSLSGQEYTDENIRIRSGSSVIIKRVPAKSSLSRRAFDTSEECSGKKDAGCLDIVGPPTMDVGENDYEDFGIDLSPPPYSNFFDMGKMLSNDTRKKGDVVPRWSQEVLIRCQKLEAAHPVKSTPKDSSANEGSMLIMPKPKIEEQSKLERISPAKHLNIENRDMPSELKCSLCRTFFKEAVMILCCQHSFCAKCICAALSENAKCPMCSSSKCKPKDLLPNVSLRQAIERFLESQLLLNGSENDLHRYALDGESRIQVKDISSATTVPHRRLQVKQSAVWDSSNQIMQSKLHNRIQPCDNHDCEPLEDCSEFQGENEPQNLAGTKEEADSFSKKGEGFRVITRGGDRKSAGPGRLHRGPRTCYMCGSPDHLIRDCPGAANAFPNHWSGVGSRPGPVSSYPPPYWPGNPSHSAPFLNMYGGPGMMFYNSSAAPISPYTFSCTPSTYGGYPVVSGYMNVGGMTSPTANIAEQPRQVALSEFCSSAKQLRNYAEDLGREGISNRGQNAIARHEWEEKSPHHSGESFGRLGGKHRSHDNSVVDTYSNCKRQGRTALQHHECGRYRRISESDGSSCENDVLDNRRRPRENIQDQVYRTVGRNDKIRGQHGCDFVQKHYTLIDESSKRKRTAHDERKYDRHSHSRSRSNLEASYCGDGSRKRREEAVHKRLTGKIKYLADNREYYHSHKRKRFH